MSASADPLPGSATLSTARSEGLVAAKVVQHKLEELKQQCSTLQRFVRLAPIEAGDSIPGVVAGLQRSLEGLQPLLANLPLSERSRSSAPFARHGTRIEATLPRLGKHFLAVANRGPVLARITHIDSRLRWANRAWLEYTGLGIRQLRGDGWLQAVHPDDRAHCAVVGDDTWASSRLHGMEFRLRARTGQYGWFLETRAPRFTSQGSVSDYLGTAIDITEHKRAETHLTLEHSVTRTLSETSCFEAAVTPILGLLCEHLGWDVGDLSTVGTEDRTPCWKKLWSSPSLDASSLEADSRTRALPDGDGASWQVGQPNWIADIALDESLARTPEAQQVGLHGMFRMAITVHGEVRAVLRLFCRVVRPKDAAVEELLTAIVAQIGLTLEHQRSVALNRDSEALRAAILEAAPDAVISIDHQRRVVTFNAAAEEVFGYRREQVLGRDLLGLVVPSRMREHVLSLFEDYLATGECGPPGRRLVAFAMRSDGSELPVEVTMASSRGGPRSLLTIFVCDVTARENAERRAGHYRARLQALIAEQLVAEERERRRLAVELHDGLSRTFSLTRTRLSALRASMGDRFSPSLDEIACLVEQANAAALSLGFELNPPSLNDSGLEPAVHWLVESIKSRYGLEIELDADALPKPADEQTRVILFRSIRELLINAARHAQAHRIRVLLEREGSRLKASIEDDGVGMQGDAAILEGSGLFSIRERLGLVGGSMRIESVPGHGTKVKLCAPLASKELMGT